MGLFDKKTCAICGASVGLLGGLSGENLAGGAYMCGDCRKKCIPDETLNFKAFQISAFCLRQNARRQSAVKKVPKRTFLTS